MAIREECKAIRKGKGAPDQSLHQRRDVAILASSLWPLGGGVGLLSNGHSPRVERGTIRKDSLVLQRVARPPASSTRP